ncbi:MAG: pyruvate ferredoxin oxidoreductase [Dethiobacter sp.]|jgi:pyruvate ferredoxin oxidoreductase alpha subunit|nr:pyruvate ferredoxin oxidoreductase [Dethiobacter sp.]
MHEKKVMEGSVAVAHAIKSAKAQVIAAYPISPQTHIIEEIAKMIADNTCKSTFIRVDSEFSAASVVYGASATGVRSYTASSSQGLLLMSEVLYAMAGTRLPVVITGVNRTVSAPITIQPDLQDSMALRDSGIIQLYVESIQEAYATHIQAFKLAEDHDVLLPVMVCMDGWILTHLYEPVKLEEQELIDKFLPSYKPKYMLDSKAPLTYGSYADDEVSEFRFMMHFAQEKAKEKINSIAREYENVFGDYFGGIIDHYFCDDAEIVIVAMGSVIGTLKEAIHEIRKSGTKIGLLKVRSYRPFPGEEILDVVKDAKIVAVIDKSLSVGQGGQLASDLKAAFYNKKAPYVLSCIAGMGGREIAMKGINKIIEKCKLALENDSVPFTEYIDLKEEYLK